MTRPNSSYVTCKEGTKTIKGWVKRNTFFLHDQDFKAVHVFVANQNLYASYTRQQSTSMYYQSIPALYGAVPPWERVVPGIR